MALEIIEAPKGGAEFRDFVDWFQRVYLWIRNTRHRTATSGDADATINKDVGYHGVTTLTSGRTLTLPAASDCEDGRQIIVQDESGDAGTFNIAIQRTGSDTVNGTTAKSITTDYGRLCFIKNGAGKWFSA